MNYVLIGPIYPYRGGIAHHTAMLAQSLRKRSTELHVVSFRRQYPRWLYPGKSDRDPSQKPLRVAAEYLLDPLYPWTWWEAFHRIMEWKPDVVVFQWWVTFWAPAFFVLSTLLRQRGMKILFIIHNVMPHEPRPWDRWLARLALQRGDGFLLQSGREKERLLSLLPKAQTNLTPLPYYDMFVAQRISTVDAKKALSLPVDEPVALFFGITRPYKGLKFAIEAMAELHSNGMPLHLLVAGEIWGNPVEYTGLINQMELTTWIRIDNRYIPDEEVGLYFSAADVFVAPYIEGTQSAAVKIALSFNLPVVVSQAIASEELQADTLHRLYWVPPSDSRSLAIAIKESLQECGLNNQASIPAVATGDWEHLAKAIEEMVNGGNE